MHASSEGDFDTAFTTCVQMGAGGLLVAADALFSTGIKKSLRSRHVMQYRPSMNGVTSF